jgi:hypothetical protein
VKKEWKQFRSTGDPSVDFTRGGARAYASMLVWHLQFLATASRHVAGSAERPDRCPGPGGRLHRPGLLQAIFVPDTHTNFPLLC